MIRPGEPGDEPAVSRLRAALWPDEAANEDSAEVRALLAGEPPGLLPAAVLVAEIDGAVVGFVEVGLRSFVDGCAVDRPVGYLEGWYVAQEHRGRGIGRALVEAAEDWSRHHGCREMGSDTWFDNPGSRRAHEALGFEEVDRCVNYRKSLASGGEVGEGTLYGPDLAALHHAHYGSVARDAASELLNRLASAGIRSGLIVDLAAGSGILSRRMVDAGFDAFGVDLSAAMLRIARDLVPEGTFVEGSLWTVPLPGGVAAFAAVGEAFSYATDPAAGLSGLRRRLASIHRALMPGGLLLFDVAGPGRSGPGGSRERCFHHGRTLLRVVEQEDGDYLSRDLATWVPLGRLYRRSDEAHRLFLYRPEDVESLLSETGFSWQRLSRYRETEMPPGWHAFVAWKEY